MSKSNTRPTSVELFAGAGGLALGCELAGFHSLATVEIDRWACDTIRENRAAGHQLVEHWNVVEGDVRLHDWTKYGPDVSLLSAGPPCQPFSAGGHGRAADDPRDMFPATADVVAAIRPKAFLIENVCGLTRKAFNDYFEYVQLRFRIPEVAPRCGEAWWEHNERMVREATTSISTLRYHLTSALVQAADYGTPQRRHRVFLIGIRDDITTEWKLPPATHSAKALIRDQWVTGEYWDRHGVPTSRRPGRPSQSQLAAANALDSDSALAPWRTVRDAISSLPHPNTPEGRAIPNHRRRPGARSYNGHTGSPLDQPAKTLKAGVHGVPGGENMLRHPNGAVRYFTVRESAVLQGFPLDYELHGSWGEAMRQLGNAVPVDLAETMAASVMTVINNATDTSVGRRSARTSHEESS
jgi:DNA (cytosine-5)-methyltransferase 1